MIRQVAPPRHQRAAVLGTVFALHAVLIALFLQQSVKVTPELRPTSVATVALAAERPAAARPPPPALPSKTADTFKPLLEFSIPSETDSEAEAGASGVCSTENLVLDALLLDQLALNAIRTSPPELRSIAGAIVIWNEGWNPIALDPNSPLHSVRMNVEKTLASVAPACLEDPVAGPRLLPIPDASGTQTIFVVVGSGSWTWGALLAPPLLPIAPAIPMSPAAPL